MRLSDWDNGFSEQALTLLEDSYRRLTGENGEELPTLFAQALAKAESLPSASALFAEDGKLEAFMLPELIYGEKAGVAGARAVVSSAGWAVSDRVRSKGSCAEALSALYARAFTPAMSRGILTHWVFCPAEDELAAEAFFDLSFGREQAYGRLELASAPPHPAEAKAPPGLSISVATAADVESLASLAPTIPRYQTGAPVWAPVTSRYLEEIEEGFRSLPEDPEAWCYLARLEGRPIGYAIAYPEAGTRQLELAVSGVLPGFRGTGVGRELFRAVLDRARAEGFRSISADWRTANPLSSRFWRSRGFRVREWRLARRLDPRNIERD